MVKIKVQKENILDEEVVQIYLSSNEAQDSAITERINEIKQNNRNVVLFVSGQEDIKATLQYIINKQAVQIV